MNKIEHNKYHQSYRKHNPIQRKRILRKCDTKRRLLMNYYKNKPCLDCGDWYNPWQMQFDHRPEETKIFTIGKSLRHRLDLLIKEITKCDLVCANCHLNRTYKRLKDSNKVLL